MDTIKESLPNLITIARLILVPIVLWLVQIGEYELAFITFILAGASDAVDGYLAKRWNVQSQLGAYLDPIADKALLTALFLMLGWLEAIPIWYVIMAVSRDILIVGGVVLSFILAIPVQIKPLPVSKANTAFQIALVSLILAERAFALGMEPLIQFNLWAAAVLTSASAGAYLWGWIQRMSTYADT